MHTGSPDKPMRASSLMSGFWKWVSCVMVVGSLTLPGTPVAAQSPAAAMIRLLQSGRVPEQRLPAIVKLACERGNADDLGYLFSEVAKEGHWPLALRIDTLKNLAVAAGERKVVPPGDLSPLRTLISSPDSKLQEIAVELAGDWRVKETSEQLAELGRGRHTPAALRRTALRSLARLDPQQAREVLLGLNGPESPFSTRILAVSQLAPLETTLAAGLAADLLKQAKPEEDFDDLLAAFLDLQQGSRALAEQLQSTPLKKDVARLLLRQMYSLGRTDPELNQALSAQAGMNQATVPPTPAEVAALVQESRVQGDPARGEAVFRRKDLSCMNCHAVSKAGGQIGPDLSAIGASSPVEYLVTSVLDPDQAIKEAFISKTILTVDGKILQGIVEDRTRDALVLKDATGKKTSIPIDDIEDEVEGKSLMPKGLVNFMTHGELLDLISFLSHLGKPGDYAIRSTSRMQRYRLLGQAPDSVLEHVPTLPVFEDAVLHAKTWEPAYARVNGDLPLQELADRVRSSVVYVRGEINCLESGAVQIRLNSVQGVTLWLDDLELGTQASPTVELSSGAHALIARIDLSQRSEPVLQVELVRPPDSAAEFNVVDGQ